MTDSGSDLQIPFAVTFSVRLFCVSLILGVMNDVLHWPELTALMALTSVTISPSSMLFCTDLITISLTIWLIFKIQLGNNWARIILFLGFIIMLPLLIPDIIEMQYYSRLYIAISVITFLLQFVALSLLFSDTGNMWFRAQKAMNKVNCEEDTP